MMQIQILVDGRIIEVIDVVNETHGIVNNDGSTEYHVEMLCRGTYEHVKHKEEDGNLMLASIALYAVMP